MQFIFKAVPRYFGLAVLTGLCGSYAIAQDPDQHGSEVQLRGSVQQDTVRLRWSYANGMAWDQARSKGVSLHRKTVWKHGSMLQLPEDTVLVRNLRPVPMDQWKAAVAQRPMAGVMLQALYGEDFELYTGSPSDALLQLGERHEMEEQRLGFAMFAADQDFDTALMAGLGYVDPRVSGDEKYYYELHLDGEEPRVIAGWYLDVPEEMPLPAPLGFSGVFYKGQIILQWDFLGASGHYLSYDLFRAEDGTDFHKLNELPITLLAEDTPYLHYSDTAVVAGKTYTYYLRGRDAFGNSGPSSEFINIRAYKVIEESPKELMIQESASGDLEVRWTYPEELNPDLSRFTLECRSRPDLAAEITRTMSPDSRQVEFSPVHPTTYITVTAEGLDGTRLTSVTAMYQQRDTIPPGVPQQFSARQVSNGIYLSWEPGSDADLRGYRLQRKAEGSPEYTDLKNFGRAESFAIDSLELKGPAQRLAYRLWSVDHKYNESLLPAEVSIITADSLPPASGILLEAMPVREGVRLRWQPGSSPDLLETTLYRKNQQGSTWQAIAHFSTSQPAEYLDQQVQHKGYYQYRLGSKDASGLVSGPSPDIAVFHPGTLERELPGGVELYPDRDSRHIRLQWRLPLKEVAQISIYRAEGTAAPGLLRVLHEPGPGYNDTQVKPHREYRYQLKILFTDGSSGKTAEHHITY